jgi:hypothetical protein
MNQLTYLIFLSAFAANHSFAADAPPSSAPAPKGALIFSDDFNRAALGDGWRITTPEFEISDGTLKATQTQPHSAVGMVKVGRKDLVIEFKFKLGGSSGVNAVCNDRDYKEGHGGHLCRVSLQPRQIFLADDKERLRHEIEEMKNDPSKKDEVAKLVAGRSIGFPTTLNPEKWYRLHIEIVGDELRVNLDDKPVGMLKSSGIAHPSKTEFYLAVSGKDALFDDLRIWSAENQ